MTTPINLPLEIWLEILTSIERIELAELCFTNRMIHAASHIRLHEEGEHIMGKLRFQKQPMRLRQKSTSNRRYDGFFKMEKNYQWTKVPFPDYELALPQNIVNFKCIEIRFG